MRYLFLILLLCQNYGNKNFISESINFRYGVHLTKEPLNSPKNKTMTIGNSK